MYEFSYNLIYISFGNSFIQPKLLSVKSKINLKSDLPTSALLSAAGQVCAMAHSLAVLFPEPKCMVGRHCWLTHIYSSRLCQFILFLLFSSLDLFPVFFIFFKYTTEIWSVTWILISFCFSWGSWSLLFLTSFQWFVFGAFWYYCCTVRKTKAM